MDKSVLDAVQRWPNVPAVYGWLSLSKRGQWRLHPNGTAVSNDHGESIHNPQIISFIDRNYMADDQGRWFFQNGPQRVYVRLDAAPFIASMTGQPVSLQTHNHLQIEQIDAWLIDTVGNVFLRCEHGSAQINDQDLELVVNCLETQEGQPLMEWWEHQGETPNDVLVQTTANSPFRSTQPIRLQLLGHDDSVAKHLGFIANPSEASHEIT